MVYANLLALQMKISIHKAIKAHYFFYFLSLGVMLPYLAPYYKELVGANDAQVGLLLMIPPLVALVAQPLWSYVADILGNRPQLVAILAVISAAAFFTVGLAQTLWVLAALLVFWAMFWTPLASMVDSVTFQVLGRQERNNYSNLRIYGTIGFMVASFSLGAFFDHYGLNWMFPLFGVCIIISAIFIRTIPPSKRISRKHTNLAIKILFRNKNIRWFIFTGILIAVANQMSYAFLSIYARDLGAKNAHLGWLWGLGTLAEALTMPFVGRLIDRFGVKKLIVLGVLASVLRWAGTAFVPIWTGLLPLQLFHGFTFAFIYVGSVTFMDVSSPSIVRSSGQAVFGMLIMNVGRIIATPLSGEIAHLFGYRILYISSTILAIVAMLLLALVINEPDQVEMDQENMFETDA
ncbi:MFS transporter [candidate division KSB1 bacterium]|nr:MFS transporter [candidate division KSB1 bacterium]